MENERKRLAALGVWTQARLDWSHPSRTLEKALVADQKRKKIQDSFFKCVYFFFTCPLLGDFPPRMGRFFFLTRTDSKNSPVSKNKPKKIINYPEYPGHCIK